MNKEELKANIQANRGRNNPAWAEAMKLYNQENPKMARLKTGCGGCYETCKRWLGIQ